MNIVKGFPPNINKIWERFELLGQPVVFTYGNTLYNPFGGTISQDLMVHEQVHEAVQTKMGVEKWWDKYLEDDKFRLDEEVLAYKTQYNFVKQTMSRQVTRALLDKICKDLSGVIYGKLVTYDEAEKLICQ